MSYDEIALSTYDGFIFSDGMLNIVFFPFRFSEILCTSADIFLLFPEKKKYFSFFRATELCSRRNISAVINIFKIL